MHKKLHAVAGEGDSELLMVDARCRNSEPSASPVDIRGKTKFRILKENLFKSSELKCDMSAETERSPALGRKHAGLPLVLE
jgi:hypothetical protein